MVPEKNLFLEERFTIFTNLDKLKLENSTSFEHFIRISLWYFLPRCFKTCRPVFSFGSCNLHIAYLKDTKWPRNIQQLLTWCPWANKYGSLETRTDYETLYHIPRSGEKFEVETFFVLSIIPKHEKKMSRNNHHDICP